MSLAHSPAARGLDLLAALLGLLLLAVPMLLIAGAVKATSRGPVLFTQWRVGRHGRRFRIWKFRTMRAGAAPGGAVTVAGDRRVTPLGRLLRRTKLDELPQLFHVARGTMSLVGPRPDVAGYADRLAGAERRLLEFRPGVTGPASVLFRHEEAILAAAADPLRFNDEVVFREKVRVNLEYLERWGLGGYAGCIVVTLLPQVARRAGLAARLGLECEAFTARMLDRARAFGTGAQPRVPA